MTQWSTTAAQIAGGRGSFASGDGRAGHQPGRLFRANNGLVQRDMIGTVVPTPRSRPRPDPAPHARAIVAKAPNCPASCCKNDPQPPTDVAPITLPRSPASLSSGNEVPHIFTRKSRVQPKEILITSAKRLLQQNLPFTDSCTASKTSWSGEPK